MSLHQQEEGVSAVDGENVGSEDEKRFVDLLDKCNYDERNYDDNADDAIRTLLIKLPELARKRYKFWTGNSYPLGQALYCGASFDVIKLLCEAFPAAVKEKNYDVTPLHWACCNGASLEVVRLLFEAYPAAIEEKDTRGRYPLHCACEYGALLEVVQFLCEAYPTAVKEKSDDEMYPLHRACCCGASLEMIQFLHKAYPTAVKEKKSSMGWYPLHSACLHGASPEVVQFLYDAYPAAIEEKDALGRYPLHLADFGSRGASLEMIQILHKANPAAVKEKDSNGMYPLHHACRSVSSLEVIKFLHNAYPEAVKENDGEGMTPLLRACHNDDCALLQFVRFFLEVYPDAVKKEDNEGITPIAVIDAYGNMEPLHFDVLDCLKITHSFVSLNNPTDEELCFSFKEFHSMAWWGGVMLVINTYPSIIHKLHFDLSIMPDIFAKIGRVSKVGTFFEVMKGLPDMMKDVSYRFFENL